MGAGLLAKRPCQSTYNLNDTPPSRASPLPQGVACIHDLFVSGMKKPAATAGFFSKQIARLR
ncbi:hypothetical protein FE275_21385 [Pseudomonas koreensis]|nr:hypothetical protein FE275_21385 [Pseudomonas koreensis]